MGQIRNFRDLDAWNAAMDLVAATYDIGSGLPGPEQFGLRAQMRHAAVSIPSNIAEGHAGGSGRRYRHFVRIALGSLAELDTQLEVALRLKYLDPQKVAELGLKLTRTRQLLHGLHRSLRAKVAIQTLAFAALLGCSATFLLFK
jgi:four helix bundle protein